MLMTEIDVTAHFQFQHAGRPMSQRSDGAATFAALLAERADSGASNVALRHKRLGVWREWSWGELWADVRRVAKMLTAGGLEPGGVVAIAGTGEPELLLAFLGALLAGGRVAPLGRLRDEGQWRAWLSELRPRVVVADRVDSALPLLVAARETGHRVGFVSVQGALAADASAGVLWSAGFAEWQGGEVVGADEPYWRDAARRASGCSPTLIFTETSASGVRIWSTDESRLVAAGRACAGRERLRHDDEALAEEPVWFIPEIASGLAAWLVAGFRLNLPESAATHAVDRREIGPTYLFARRGALAALAVHARDALGPPGGVKRRLVEHALAVAHRSGRSRLLPDPWQLIVRALLLRPLRDVLGLARVRVLVSVDGELDASTHEFLSGLDVGPTDLSAAHRVRPEPVRAGGSPVADGDERAPATSSSAPSGRATPEETLPVAARLGALY
jgi:long-subunit acyl-CoA synthetase (AMP-forming)